MGRQLGKGGAGWGRGMLASAWSPAHQPSLELRVTALGFRV